MTDRLLNYLFAFIIIVLFVIFADETGQTWILAALFLGLVTVLMAYLSNALTIDGAGAALTVGVVSMGFGTWTGAVLVLFFFISSYGLAYWFDRLESGKRDQPKHRLVTERRNGYQVWANSFWFVLLLTAFYIFGERWMIVCAAAAIAAATSDTWSSMIGVRFSKEVRLITNFQVVTPGTDGGVSYTGTMAALTGAAAMAFLFLITGYAGDTRAGLIILVSGFSGCIVDSYLGAIFQYHKTVENWLPDIRNSMPVRVIKRTIPDNDGVNFLATGIAVLIAFLLY